MGVEVISVGVAIVFPFLPLLAGIAALLSLVFLRGVQPLIGVPLALGSFAIIVGVAFFSASGWSTRGLDAMAFIGIMVSGAWYFLVGITLIIGCLIRVATYRGPKVFWPPGLLVAGAMAAIVDGLLFAVGPRAFPTNIGPGALAVPIGNLLIPLSVAAGLVVMLSARWGCAHASATNSEGDRD